MLLEQCIKFLAENSKYQYAQSRTFHCHNKRICALSLPLYKSIYRFSNSCFKVINSKVSIHRTGAASPWLTKNTTVCVIKSYT